MKTIIILITMLIPLTILAESLKNKNFGNVTVKEVVSIYDADTFRVNIKGWPEVAGYRMSIRLNGIDAPEMRGKCQKEKDQARAAKKITVKFLRSSKVIQLRNMKRGKYFRIIADVFGDGKRLADALIKSGLVREYHGGKREGWCK